ncbi:MAG: type II toxin-antitoxin system RelE/ParE family toxin [Candidatus Cloacimonetes bacterium]|nr:type II toxin-antitoxin system RelE/ParE family toxin [Candidatus Cloacimonadota bacterium]
MAYKIEYKASVAKDLKKIDKTQINKLLDKIDNDLANNPGKDKELTGEFKGLYSYRVGNYRVIYTILESKETVLILRIGHKKEVYINK